MTGPADRSITRSSTLPIQPPCPVPVVDDLVLPSGVMIQGKQPDDGFVGAGFPGEQKAVFFHLLPAFRLSPNLRCCGPLKGGRRRGTLPNDMDPRPDRTKASQPSISPLPDSPMTHCPPMRLEVDGYRDAGRLSIFHGASVPEAADPDRDDPEAAEPDWPVPAADEPAGAEADEFGNGLGRLVSAEDAVDPRAAADIAVVRAVLHRNFVASASADSSEPPRFPASPSTCCCASFANSVATGGGESVHNSSGARTNSAP